MPDRVRLWEQLSIVGAIAGLVAPLILAQALGGFAGRSDGEVSSLGAFGILGAFCFPVAAWFFASMKREQALAAESRTWPTVPGEMLRMSDEREGQLYDITYKVEVVYRYEVDGRRYENSTLGYGPSRLNAGTMVQELLAKYQAKAPVTVHYDPAAPGTSVLETSDAMALQRKVPTLVLLGVPFAGAAFMAIRHVAR